MNKLFWNRKALQLLSQMFLSMYNISSLRQIRTNFRKLKLHNITTITFVLPSCGLLSQDGRLMSDVTVTHHYHSLQKAGSLAGIQ